MARRLTQIALEMDRQIASGDVMPDSWHGYARIVIGESDLSGKEEAFALKFSERVLDETDINNAETAARKSIEQARGRFDE